MINLLDSIQYIMDEKKPHSEIGFIGLGIMGKPMAKNLVDSGFKVYFFARKQKIIKEMVSYGGKYLNKIQDISQKCKVIFLNLPNSKDVKNVVLSKNGLWHNLQKNTIIIDMSTISPETTKEVFKKLKTKNVFLIDAPVSGGEMGAINGDLSIMVGGNKKIYNKIKSLLSILGKNITYIGPTGSGQITKACNQILVAGTMVAVSEIFLLAKKSKCNLNLIQKALLGGFANSKILDIHGKRMIKKNYKPGFKTRLHLKDLNIALNLSKNLNIDLKSAKYSKKLMLSAVNSGEQNKDSSIINKIIQKNNK